MARKTITLLRNLLLSSSLLLLSACNGDDSRIYNEFQHIDGNGWQYQDPKVFSLPRMKEALPVSLFLQLRTDNRYPYTNLTVIAEEKVLPSGKTFRKTLRLPINSTKGINLHESEFPVNNLQLHRGDSLVVTVFHNMRRESIPGIEDVGLLVK